MFWLVLDRGIGGARLSGRRRQVRFDVLAAAGVYLSFFSIFSFLGMWFRSQPCWASFCGRRFVCGWGRRFVCGRCGVECEGSPFVVSGASRSGCHFVGGCRCVFTGFYAPVPPHGGIRVSVILWAAAAAGGDVGGGPWGELLAAAAAGEMPAERDVWGVFGLSSFGFRVSR